MIGSLLDEAAYEARGAIVGSSAGERILDLQRADFNPK